MRSPSLQFTLKLIAVGVIVHGLAHATFAATEPRNPAPFATAELTVGKTTYRDIRVIQVSPRSITFTHSGGLASAPLRDLPVELQRQFGYDPELARARETQLAQADAENRQRLARLATTPKRQDTHETKLTRLLRLFGQPIRPQAEVDLRPRFRELELSIKNQGRRPSCSVFAIVSALEYQNAELAGFSEKLSEEYLIWATYRSTHRAQPSFASLQQAEDDYGFSLQEVVTSLRTYGIATQAELPNSRTTPFAKIADPSDQLIARAQQRNLVNVHNIPGATRPARIENILHALDAGYPIPIGLTWPLSDSIRDGVIDKQLPAAGYSHAVTLVGYRCPSGEITDTVFIYKNSYGPTWGRGGYGTVSYRYLELSLHTSVLLEVDR